MAMKVSIVKTKRVAPIKGRLSEVLIDGPKAVKNLSDSFDVTV
jgi:hypothetical protein